MFQNACSRIRNAVYGIMCWTKTDNQVNYSNGTAFMISPGIIATASHVIHCRLDPENPLHSVFEVIRAPDVGQRTERAHLIAEDIVRDLALLQIDKTRSNQCVVLEQNIVPIGTICGSLGFPLSNVIFTPRRKFNLVERFQGAYVSAFQTQTHPSGRCISYYETDALMYRGSSGCPGFTVNTNIFGLHNKSVVKQTKTQANQRSRLRQTERFAISLWIPSKDIIQFASSKGVTL